MLLQEEDFSGDGEGSGDTLWSPDQQDEQGSGSGEELNEDLGDYG